MKRKLTCFLLALTLSLSLALPAAAAPAGFPDVPAGEWYYEPVMELVELGVVTGYSDGAGGFYFDPMKSVKAVEFCKMALGVVPPGESVNALAEEGWTGASVLRELERLNPDYWGNAIIQAALLRGVDALGWEKANWDRVITRAEMVYILCTLYRYSDEQPELTADTRVTWLIGDYTSDVLGHQWELEILWAYSQGLVDGTNTNGDFDPEDTLDRASACTILNRFYHPEKRLTVDWAEAERRSEEAANAPLERLEDGTDFTGAARVRYNYDVAYDYCRALEEEIGIRIFYLPEFTEKADGLLGYSSFDSFPLDRLYFQLVLAELQKMKAAYDLYPDGFLKEMISKKNPSRGTEIILCPYTFPGFTSYGVHLYDQSSDAVKVDQIYYTGVGDEQYYSHEMGHMVMSCAAILGGWSTVTGDWDAMNQRASSADYVSSYAMASRPEDWAETWAWLWHQTDGVAALLDSGSSVLGEKIRYMTDLLDRCYDAIQSDQLPWSELLK